MTKRKKTMTDEEAFDRLTRKGEGGLGVKKTKIAEIIGVKKQAINRWRDIPAKYVTAIHKETGIPKAELRPSDFA